MKAVIKIRYCNGKKLSFPARYGEIVLHGRESLSDSEAKKIATEKCERDGNTLIDCRVVEKCDWE